MIGEEITSRQQSLTTRSAWLGSGHGRAGANYVLPSLRVFSA